MPVSSNSLSATLPDTLADNSVVCLMAPTASGKTALAYELYDTGRYELISVDSALIYREMNIGTAKPTADELARYPHHLVDIIAPTQSYSVAEFVQDVAVLIAQCHSRHKIPLLVGGTMMYYMALLDGLSFVPDSDEVVRAKVEQWRQDEGIHALYDYLGQVDALSHQRLRPTDTQRITRALEVYLQTSIPISDWQAKPKQALAHNPNQDWHALAVMPDRAWLHQRIVQRLDIMWQEGLVDEVINLLARYPLTPDMAAMRCVGYRQVLEYLVQIEHPIFEHAHLDKAQFYAAFAQSKTADPQQNTQANPKTGLSPTVGAASETKAPACYQMQNKALYATRQLAKRQYTWLRKLAKLPSTSQDNTAPAIDKDRPHNIRVHTFDNMAQVRDYLL